MEERQQSPLPPIEISSDSKDFATPINPPSPPRGRKRAASSPLPARPPPVSPSTMAPATTNISPMWQSLPVELVQRVLHELVSIHLWDIDSDPFYPWETLRQLNHQQRRRIDALYRQLLLPISNLTLWTEFCPTSKHSPDDLDSGTGLLYRFWVWDEDKGYNSTNDTITLSLAGTETMLSVDDDEGFDTSKGWTKYVNSFPPGGLYVNPQPDYGFTLKLSSPPRPGYSPDFHLSLQGEIPASHVPDVQDDSDDDSIKLSSSQLIGALIRAWKKRIIEYERQGIWKTQWYIPLERLDDLPEV